MKTTLRVLAPLATAFVLTASLASHGLAGQEKVAVCHVDPDDQERQHVVNVSGKALASHLAHGDCTDFTDGVDGTCDCG